MLTENRIGRGTCRLAWLVALLIGFSTVAAGRGPLPGAATPVHGAIADTPMVAIIIDDMGYRHTDGLRALALPGAVTYSVLPHTPFARAMADAAHARHKEVLLHLPLEPVEQEHRRLEPGTLMADMTREQMVAALEDAIAAVPHIRGINNHMGSYFTARTQPISYLMSHIMHRHEELFFIDSRTVPQSVVTVVAGEHGVATTSRDVFLDNSADPDQIGRQFDTLLRQAMRRGTALAIGHPWPQTLAVLEQRLATLDALGIRLVRVSELLSRRLGLPRGQLTLRDTQPPRPRIRVR